MSQIHSNMRLMEFLVNNVDISIVPDDCTAEDETCVTFNYLDYFQVRVKQSEYESSQYTKSKNCLFTTHDNISSEENQVFKYQMVSFLDFFVNWRILQIIVNVYKNCSDEKTAATYYGQSTINLEVVFKKSFPKQRSANDSTTSLQVN